jgi:uncharacterized membrane protein (UPF0127 family)
VDEAQQPKIARRLRGLPIADLDGRRVRVATTRAARLLGLAGITRESAESGLLIPRCRSVHTFGMRFPIDVLFLDGESRALSVRSGVRPRRVLVDRRARAVLEVPTAGSA